MAACPVESAGSGESGAGRHAMRFFSSDHHAAPGQAGGAYTAIGFEMGR